MLMRLALPESLGLLRFWLERRGGMRLPEWTDNVGDLPVAALPNVAITERRPHSVFRYVGSECLRRWGAGITGATVYDEVVRGRHGAYLKALGDDAVHYERPIYSECEYEFESARFVLGRLYAPFAYRGSAAPRVIVGLQLVLDEERQLDLRSARFLFERGRWALIDPARIIDRVESFSVLLRNRSSSDLAAQSARAAVRELAGDALVVLAHQETDDEEPGTG